MSRRKWECIDCHQDTGKMLEHYFITDDVWYKVYTSKFGMLCIGCLEERLGRKLEPADFPKVTINNPKICDMSARLFSRIMGI